MDQILEKKENINELQISSEQKAEIFKYSREEKFRVLKYIETKLQHPYKRMMPVIVYVKNKEISDIKKVIYIVNWFTSLKLLAYHVMNNQYVIEKNGSNKCDKYDCKYGFKTELSLISEDENFFLMDDLLLQEVWEDYKNNDKFLYLIFDVIDEENKQDYTNEDILDQFNHIPELIDMTDGFEKFKVEES
jgi:hypothetical protein